MFGIHLEYRSGIKYLLKEGSTTKNFYDGVNCIREEVNQFKMIQDVEDLLAQEPTKDLER